MLQELIVKARKKIGGGRQMSKWLSIKERKPSAEYGESESVLTVDSIGEMRVAYWDGGNWCLPNGNIINPGCVFPITHWMPLPEPPKEFL